METGGEPSQLTLAENFGTQSSLCPRAWHMLHPASVCTKPLNELVQRSPMTSQLLNLIQTSFY